VPWGGRPASQGVVQTVCTNTVPITETDPKLTVLSVTPMLAEAVRPIHHGESVSALFT
jgi:ribose-phosphate pyrophosphokinase